MPKRNAEEKIERYRRKISRLEEKERNRVARMAYSSPESDAEDNEDGDIAESLEAPPACSEAAIEASTSEPDAITQGSSNTAPNIATLDPDILSALGDPVEDIPEFGEEIHENLSQRWLAILKKGISKEARDKLLKEYRVPSNCALLQAPKLNAEISAAITDVARNRDKKMELSQQLLGVGLTAINRAMTLLITGDDNKIQAIKILSDGCRILSDLHYNETQARIKMVTPGLEKSFLTIIKDTERDSTLFGSNLSEKIKASRAIERQGSQIKKSAGIPKQTTNTSTIQSPVVRPRYQENWGGPSRYQPNRGGARRPEETSPYSSQVPDRINGTGSEPEQSTTSSGSAVAQSSAPTAPVTYPGCHDILRISFARRGTPSTALDLMLASLSPSTMNQYNVTFKQWWQFCQENNINKYEPSVPSILSFLSDLFTKGASYGSLNSHRSALSLLLGSNVGSDDSVKRLLKGAYKLRPSQPKYANSWDPQIVLNVIAEWVPNRELSLEKITKKLAFLLALCTAHRVQTLSLIKTNNIRINSRGIEIVITDLIKTSGAGQEQPVLFLPYFVDKPSICPATTLEYYLKATEKHRPHEVSNLLLTFKKPYRGATTQSISRWVKQVLDASGVDVATFGAHSTRHAATSTAHRSGVSLDVIRKAAGWTATSLTFAKFYNRPLIEENSFARSICFPPSTN